MNRIDEFKKEITGKKVAVLGVGISHRPLIKFLSGLGAKITAFDKRTEDKMQAELEELKEYDISYVLGDDYLEHLSEGFDYIFKTPGMRKDSPEIVKAVQSGAILTNEMQVFFELCPCEIFAITGSDGKTTTTTLITKMLEKSGFKCWIGGNIGTPLLHKVEEMNKEDKVVVELSSFQLDAMNLAPSVAVITNLSPNHLDWHIDYNEYIKSKLNILGDRHENAPKRLVYNCDNGDSVSALSDVIDNSQIESYSFSLSGAENATVYYNDGKIYVRDLGDERMVLDSKDIVIKGMHNVDNYMTAIAATYGMVDSSVYSEVASEFAGVPHRIEFVREVDGVKYYNDSIASSPKRTIAGLKSFDDKIILLAGGKDKGIPYDEIGLPIIENVKHLILVGATTDKIVQAVHDAAEKYDCVCPEITVCDDYVEMCNKARSIAKPGDVVMLSPASTSFDRFKNFEERGNVFKQIIHQF